MWLFMLGDYRLPLVTMAVGEGVWRGRSADVSYELAVEGRLPAFVAFPSRRPANDNDNDVWR